MDPSTYHLVGIGGIGMSALALILAERGHRVSGSDASFSEVISVLQEKGVKVFLEHKKEHVPKGAKVVYSSSIHQDNPEIVVGKSTGMIMHRSELLAELLEGYFPLLIAGTHGKTTTSALLAHVLSVAGREPSYYIGGIVTSLLSHAKQGKDKWFAAEADESDGSFLNYKGEGGIITNIGIDHLTFWKTKENLLKGFESFFSHIRDKKLLFYCFDSELLRSVAKEGVSYGFSKEADLSITEASFFQWSSQFSILFEGKIFENIQLALAGRHNVLNAAAVFGLCLRLGIDIEKIREGFKTFKGTKRRLEKKGEKEGIVVYDDYAHHPSEIEATLFAVKGAEPMKRIVVIFQPHRFSRVSDCFALFGPALELADVVFVTDIYSGGEAPIEGISAKTLLEKIKEVRKKPSYYSAKEDLAFSILPFLEKGDIVVTMGAGDITKLGEKILEGWN